MHFLTLAKHLRCNSHHRPVKVHLELTLYRILHLARLEGLGKRTFKHTHTHIYTHIYIATLQYKLDVIQTE